MAPLGGCVAPVELSGLMCPWSCPWYLGTEIDILLKQRSDINNRKERKLRMELAENQAALVIETSESGEITVNVAAADFDGMASKVCAAIATKLMQDVDFQEEIMEMLEDDGVA
jgi:hypothetical protein